MILRRGSNSRHWYQVSEIDRVLPLALQHLFAKEMNATTISLTSSHVSLISQQREIAQLILIINESNYQVVNLCQDLPTEYAVILGLFEERSNL